MGVGKQKSTLRQFVDIGRSDLWVTVQHADPIVEIVDRYKKKIGGDVRSLRHGQWTHQAEISTQEISVRNEHMPTTYHKYSHRTTTSFLVATLPLLIKLTK